ncbi:MAG: peptide/nickel transport system permease protein [Pseudonocardiales bacterium]|jgi:peptide/nickel transport system permease protein|nr:peptide/nickel transport system permease protein [Pseudonocardiales bacterium]MDT4904780.1 peptide/nickel transport system permease protein [Pseudonocardiales bacterium]MDT4931136.1 peptide/nickel transport system permease protein [Pseudonocardiales bacterium]
MTGEAIGGGMGADEAAAMLGGHLAGPEETVAGPGLPSQSPTRIALARFRRHRLAVAGLTVLVVLVVLALLAPLIAPFDPNAVDLAQYRRPPTGVHWLGTDEAGRDVLSRLMFGARVSLTVGVVAAVSAGLIGLVLGLLAGFLGGWVDALVMRLTEVVLSFPSLVVIILLVAVIGPSITSIVAVIALFEWPIGCRIVRQITRVTKETGFVLAARSVGASNLRLMTRHTMGSVISPLTVVVTLLSAQAILLEAALSFLGLGVNPPQASWGGMLRSAQSLTVLSDFPWLWLPPGIAIAITVLSINFVGDGLRDAFDPRQEM